MNFISKKRTCPPATTDLWNQANHHHAGAERAARSAIEQARLAGEVLIRLKAECRHGEWGRQLKEHFSGSARTARSYMQLARNWEEIESKTAESAVLSVDEALKILAAPRSPEEISRMLDALCQEMTSLSADESQRAAGIAQEAKTLERDLDVIIQACRGEPRKVAAAWGALDLLREEAGRWLDRWDGDLFQRKGLRRCDSPDLPDIDDGRYYHRYGRGSYAGFGKTAGGVYIVSCWRPDEEIRFVESRRKSKIGPALKSLDFKPWLTWASVPLSDVARIESDPSQHAQYPLLKPWFDEAAAA
jgi:hypothetical protein